MLVMEDTTMHEGFTWLDTTVLVLYLLGVLLAGLYFSKKEMKGKEFFKGDGTIPWWVTCVSIFATLLARFPSFHCRAILITVRGFSGGLSSAC